MTSDRMDITVRDVTPDDAEAIAGILNRIIAARCYTVLDTPFSVADERRFIENFPARGIWKVAARAGDDRAIGFQVLEPFATYTPAFDHVASLGTFVDLDLRRRGIAKRLFPETFAAARAKGYEKIFTFVRADNPAALETYTRHGFRVIGTASRQAKIDGRYIDEVLIEAWLID